MAVAKSASKPKSIYSVHPGVAMMQKWVAELPEKTGKTLEQWVAVVQRDGPKEEAARRDWLKHAHGFGTNASWWIAERARPAGQRPTEDGDPESYLKAAEEYVEKMFAGGKAGLRPIFEELLKLGNGLGKDVKICPCQTMVPLYRNHVFAQIKPTTRTRVDFGLCLTPLIKDGKQFPARLIDTGGFAKKDRITHRFAITALDDINADVKRWLKKAYELDAKA